MGLTCAEKERRLQMVQQWLEENHLRPVTDTDLRGIARHRKGNLVLEQEYFAGKQGVRVPAWRVWYRLDDGSPLNFLMVGEGAPPEDLWRQAAQELRLQQQHQQWIASRLEELAHKLNKELDEQATL